MDPRALSTINALAIMFNACAASICALSLAMIWFAIVRKAVWAFWCLAGCLGFLQAAGFASDTFLGNKDVLANAISSLLLFCGIFSVGIAILNVRDKAQLSVGANGRCTQGSRRQGGKTIGRG